jgi:hypothetical protein
VSCDPTAITSKAAPTWAATSSRREPTRDRIDKERNSERGKLSLPIKVAFQVPEPISSSPVVEALVRSPIGSPPGKPESQQIRHHQHSGRVIDDTGFLINSKLVDQIERLELPSPHRLSHDQPSCEQDQRLAPSAHPDSGTDC